MVSPFTCVAVHGNEILCPNFRFEPKPSTEWFRCQTGPNVVFCLARTHLCDGHVDCEDASDEENCGRPILCELHLYTMTISSNAFFHCTMFAVVIV